MIIMMMIHDDSDDDDDVYNDDDDGYDLSKIAQIIYTVFYCFQIGVMIGFAITACVEAGVMVIIYSIALGEIAQRLRCPNYIDYRHGHGYNTYSYDYDNCYYNSYYRRLTYSEAQVGAALCSLLLILAVLEFFVALASSIYGCNACCCSGPTVQVMIIINEQCSDVHICYQVCH